MSYCVSFLFTSHLSFKQDGEIVPQNLHNFLSDADFPSNGNKCPESWHTEVKALRDEMTTHVVITAICIHVSFRNIDSGLERGM